jgi:hypothetical protein
MKIILKRIFAFAFVSFLITFLIVFLTHVGEPRNRMLNIGFGFGILASSAAVFFPSAIGLFLSNSALVREKKTWIDFWSEGIFEYFYNSEDTILDSWRIARGKYILYFLLIISTFAIDALYFRL